MKLSEIDKSKLPVKVVSNTSGEIFRVAFVDDEYALVYNSHSKPCAFLIDDDCWSLCEEPKQKVALYMYKHKLSKCWSQTAGFYKDEAEARKNFTLHADCEVRRLMWSEVEV